MILPDTTIWIEFFRGREPICADLARRMEDGDILAVAWVFGEILQVHETPGNAEPFSPTGAAFRKRLQTMAKCGSEQGSSPPQRNTPHAEWGSLTPPSSSPPARPVPGSGLSTSNSTGSSPRTCDLGNRV